MNIYLLWELLCCSGWGYCLLFLLFLAGAIKRVFIPLRNLKSFRYLEPLKTPVSTRKSLLIALAMTVMLAITFWSIAIILHNTDIMHAYRSGLTGKEYIDQVDFFLQNMSWFFAFAQMTVAGWVLWILNNKNNSLGKNNILWVSYHKVFLLLAMINLVAGCVSIALNGKKQGYSRYGVYVVLIQLFAAFMIFHKEKLKNRNVLRFIAIGVFMAVGSRNIMFKVLSVNERNYLYEGPSRIFLAIISLLICVILVLKFKASKERLNKSILLGNVFLLLISFCVSGNTICNAMDKFFDVSELLTGASGVIKGVYVNSIHCGQLDSRVTEAPEPYTMYLITTQEEEAYAEEYLGMKQPDDPEEIKHLFMRNIEVADAFQEMKAKYPISDYNYLIFYYEDSVTGNYYHADSVKADGDRIEFHYDLERRPEIVGCAFDGFLHMAAVRKDFFTNRTFSNTVSPIPIEYDIEKVFTDPAFSQIMHGDTIPCMVIHGIGSEGGYEQYSTSDRYMILDYIKVFRKFKIDDVITDKEKMVFVDDAVNNYIFCMDDGSKVIVSIEANRYVIIRSNMAGEEHLEKEYVLKYNVMLNELNHLIYINENGSTKLEDQ